MTGRRVVDTHSHIIPPILVEAMRSGTAPDGIVLDESGDQPWVVHRQGYRYPLLPGFHEVAGKLATMDATGVTVSVLSVAPPLFLYWVGVSEAVAAATMVNDAIASMVAEAPDRFAGLATLPMQDPEVAAVELRRAVGELGLRGAQVGPHVEGVGLDNEVFRPVLRTAEELGVPLVLHPYYAGAASGELADFYLTNLQGNPWQTAVSASRLILSGTLDELPGLRLVLVHGGGHLPYQVGRLDHGHRVRPEAARPQHPPSAYLRRFFFDTLTHDADATRFLVDKVGGDRVVLGTDDPFDMAGGAFGQQTAAITGDRDLEQLASGNADALFGLQPSSPTSRTANESEDSA